MLVLSDVTSEGNVTLEVEQVILIIVWREKHINNCIKSCVLKVNWVYFKFTLALHSACSRFNDGLDEKLSLGLNHIG